MSRIAVCADDFGLSPEVNRAITELAWQGRVSATSCLVDGPAFEAGASTLRLLQRAGLIDIGLHLNLTESFGDAHPRWPLGRLIGRAYGGVLRRSALVAEVRRQLDRFEDVLGFAPDHVDGHQHVHQLPRVRAAVLEAIEAAFPAGGRPWVRHCASAWRASAVAEATTSERMKPLAIGLLGAGALRRELRARGMGFNRRLLGLYSDACTVQHYIGRLEHWARHAAERDLLMCHPAMPPAAQGAMSTGRAAEFRVFASPVLLAVFRGQGLTLHRMSRLLEPGAA